MLSNMISRIFPLFTALFFVAGAAYGTERGESLFKLCVACHGEKGEGNQKLAAPAIAGLPSWYVEAQLTKFRDGIRGKHPGDIGGMRMRPMARTLPLDGDIALVSAHVANMRPAANPVPAVKGSVVRGEELFKVCVSCHGPEAKGNQTVSAPPLVNSSDWYLVTQLKHFKEGIRGGNATVDPNGATMKGMAGTLDEQGVNDVVYYIQTLR